MSGPSNLPTLSATATGRPVPGRPVAPDRVRVDASAVIVAIGAAAAARIGRDPASVVGMRLDEVVAIGDAPALRQHLSTSDRVPVRVRVRRCGGTPAWGLVRMCEVGSQVAGTREFEVADAPVSGASEPLRSTNQVVLAEMLAMSTEAVAVIDTDATVLWVSDSLTSVLGWLPEELVGMSGFEFVHPDDVDEMVSLMLGLLERGHAGKATVARLIDAAGELVHMRLTATAPAAGWVGAAGEPTTVVALWLHDVTAQLEAEVALRSSEAQLRSVLASNSDITMLTDERLGVMWASPSMESLLGVPLSSIVGGSLPGFADPADVATLTAMARRVGGGASADPTTVRLITAVGERVWVELVMARAEDPDAAGAIVVSARDVTVRRSLETRLAQAATQDHLTRLWNRAYVIAALEESLELLEVDPSGSLALLFVDIDRFKSINDTRGHAVGDQILVQLAARLRSLAADEDIVGRLGGDEFVIVRRRPGSDDELDGFVDRLGDAFRFPFRVGELELVVTGSVGVVTTSAAAASRNRVTALELLRNVDIAMYRAKSDGRNRVVHFDDDLRRGVIERLELEAFLRQAVLRDELLIHFQPVIDLNDGRWIGLEALVRWMHPRLGLLHPGNFVGLAEEAGLLASVDEWVVGEAVRALSQWRSTFGGAESLWVSVNVGAQQIGRPDFAELIATTLDRYDVPADCLVLELTERSLGSEADRGFDAIAELVAAGVHLAIDDFGTGHSALTHLLTLPIEMVKIDRSFIASLIDNERDKVIVSAIIGMCRSLGISVVAEGMELREQIPLLAGLGCAGGQGYLFDRPLPMPEVIGRFLQAAGMAYGQRELGPS